MSQEKIEIGSYVKYNGPKAEEYVGIVVDVGTLKGVDAALVRWYHLNVGWEGKNFTSPPLKMLRLTSEVPVEMRASMDVDETLKHLLFPVAPTEHDFSDRHLRYRICCRCGVSPNTRVANCVPIPRPRAEIIAIYEDMIARGMQLRQNQNAAAPKPRVHTLSTFRGNPSPIHTCAWGLMGGSQTRV